MAIGLAQIQSGIFAAFGATYVATPTPSGGWNIATWPIVAENQSWSLAKNGAATQPADKAWGRICVRFADSRDTSVDAKARRVTGIVWLQVFVPENTGSLTAQKVGDEMERIFGRKTIVSSGEVIRFERAITRYVGKTENGWEQHACTVDFMSDAVTP